MACNQNLEALSVNFGRTPFSLPFFDFPSQLPDLHPKINVLWGAKVMK
jgi:hypothetical protein